MEQKSRYPRVVYDPKKTAKLQNLPVFPMLKLAREWIEACSLTRTIRPHDYFCHFDGRFGHYSCEYHISHTERWNLLFSFQLTQPPSSSFSGNVDIRKVFIQRRHDSPETNLLVPEGLTYTFNETGVTWIYHYCEEPYMGEGIKTLGLTLISKWPNAIREYDSPQIQKENQ